MSDAPKPVEPRPSGTAIALRDADGGIEVLLVHKGGGRQFHAGSWVFPGGAVDDDDRAGLAVDDHLAACRVAAIRETFEESGVQVEPESLVAFSHWTTPEMAPRRFATWFFLATVDAGAEQVPTFDGHEIQDAAWMTPASAFERHHAGEIDLPIPQYVSLLGLRHHPTVAAARHAALATDPVQYLGQLRDAGDGQMAFVYEADAAYGGHPLDAPGPRHRLLIDGRHMSYQPFTP